MDTKVLAHFIWIGETGLPPFYQKCINSFYQKHPLWNIKLWTVKDADKIIQNSKYDFFKYNTFINRYNFIKYHILAQEGGWFVDLDITWKRSIDQIYTDKLSNRKFPDMFVPVRSHPRQKQTNLKQNDDMLIYARKGIFYDLLEFINNRDDVDDLKKYDPYGPLSLSRWVHSTTLDTVYLYEEEIQQNGHYCSHNNNQSWIFS